MQKVFKNMVASAGVPSPAGGGHKATLFQSAKYTTRISTDAVLSYHTTQYNNQLLLIIERACAWIGRIGATTPQTRRTVEPPAGLPATHVYGMTTKQIQQKITRFAWTGYTTAYSTRYRIRYSKGYSTRHSTGYSTGCSTGHSTGCSTGYSTGCSTGCSTRYSTG